MSNRYFQQLNGLRALAVLAVVATHTLDATHRSWVVWGEEGVTLFFVISGFLITGILLDARDDAEHLGLGRSIVWRSFYARRFLRIFPVYYATILVAAVIGFEGVRQAFWWHVAYLSNWYIAFDQQWNVATHTWSLAVEEQFYLLWPLALLLAPRRLTPWLIGAMVAIGPATRVVLLISTDMWRPGIAIITPSVLDALGLGAALAWAWRSSHGPLPLVRASVIGGACLFVLNRTVVWSVDDAEVIPALTQIWIPLLFVGVVHAASKGVPGPIGRVLTSAPLVHVGVVSYGIYLFHPFIEQAIHRAGEAAGVPLPEYGLIWFVSISLLSTATATVSWRWFEGPINGLKSHFPYVPDVRSSDEPANAASS